MSGDEEQEGYYAEIEREEVHDNVTAVDAALPGEEDEIDLMDDDMFNDYQPMPQLDTLENVDLDK